MNVAHTSRYASSAYWIDGMADHSTPMRPLTDSGADTHPENRNIHFMNVTAEYFAISGLNIPRYIEKLKMLRTIMKIPNGVLSATPSGLVDLLTIRYMIPAKLIATPPAFFMVMGSFIANAAMIIV